MENQTLFATPTVPMETGGIDVVTIIIKTLYTCIGILGIGGNGLILAMLIKIPALRNTTNLLIGHQSVIDFSSSVLLLATFLPPPLHDMTELWQMNPALAEIFCKLWVSRLFYWTAIKASTANLVCLTLERYVAVVHPLKYREKLKITEATIICSIIWFVGFLVQIYQLKTFFVEDGICVLKYSFKGLAYLSGIWIFCMTLLVPLLVMSFVYVSIFLALPRKVSPVTSNNAPSKVSNPTHSGVTEHNISGGTQGDRETPITDMLHGGEGQQKNVTTTRSLIHPSNHKPAKVEKGRGEDKRDKVRRNVLSTMVIVSVTYTICWTPNQIYFLYFNLGGELDLNGGLYYCTVLAAAANMFINPIIYAFKYKKFQDGMKQMVFGKRFSQTNDSTAGSNPRS
ncbi:5-hydroxytryptamine receptor 1A-like [Apostichopus japonicus]|uniref:5-hydroxytryptamine receptor 1A-like n=1 Tax=Stichopus japonicus TaxID=307972 RepID=UPI003AB594AB